LTNRGRRARLEDLQRVGEALREPVEAPDLSAAILARVDSQRCFLSGRARMLVWVGRGGAAMMVALVVLGVTLANRYSPSTFEVVAQPRPVSDVISAVSTQASEQLTALRGSLVQEGGEFMELTSLLANVTPANELAQPIGAAIQAVRFVGPPVVAQTESPGRPGDWEVVASVGASRLPRMSTAAWPAVGIREAMEDRRRYEDESPLLSGTGMRSSIAPK